MGKSEAPRVWLVLQQTLQHIDRATEKEADMIWALTNRYIADYEPAQRRKQDEAYAEDLRPNIR